MLHHRDERTSSLRSRFHRAHGPQSQFGLCGVDSKSVQLLAETLHDNTSLTWLTLRGCYMEEPAARAWGTLLSKTRSLRCEQL